MSNLVSILGLNLKNSVYKNKAKVRKYNIHTYIYIYIYYNIEKRYLKLDVVKVFDNKGSSNQ